MGLEDLMKEYEKRLNKVSDYDDDYVLAITRNGDLKKEIESNYRLMEHLYEYITKNQDTEPKWWWLKEEVDAYELADRERQVLPLMYRVYKATKRLEDELAMESSGECH